MASLSKIGAAVVVLLLTVATNSGCHHAFGCKTFSSRLWRLDSERKIEVFTSDSVYPLWAGDELTYSRVSLRIVGEDGSQLGDAELGYRYGLERMKAGPIKLANIEVRTDENRTKLWIVDADARTVFATYNLETGEASNRLQHRPSWAKPQSGILLERIDPEPTETKGPDKG